MSLGLLYRERRAKDELADRILRAASAYQRMYGRRPEVCYVHPSCQEGLATLPQMEVRADEQIQPDQFYLGLFTGR